MLRTHGWRRVAAVDLGSSATRVWVAGGGLVLDVPTAGPRPPVRHGAVTDPDACARLLHRRVRRADVTVAVPALDDTDREQVPATLRRAGAAAVTVVEAPLAAAVGAGVDIAEPVNELVVDIGAGLLEVAAVGDGTVLAQRVLPCGLGDLAQVLRQQLADTDGVTASAGHTMRGLITGHVTGRHLDTGAARQVPLTRSRLDTLLDAPLRAVRQTALDTLGALPAGRAADIAATGAVLVGGGAAVIGLPARLRDTLRMPVRIANTPTLAVLHGLARLATAPH